MLSLCYPLIRGLKGGFRRGNSTIRPRPVNSSVYFRMFPYRPVDKRPAVRYVRGAVVLFMSKPAGFPAGTFHKGNYATFNMAGITLEQAEAQLTVWLAASTAVAGGQSYSLSTGTTSRTLTRANAKEIRDSIDYWDRKVTRLGGSGISVRGIIPIDTR